MKKLLSLLLLTTPIIHTRVVTSTPTKHLLKGTARENSYSANGKIYVTIDEKELTLYVWDAISGTLLHELKHPGYDGQRIAFYDIANDGSSITVYITSPQVILWTL